jgi:hypothetical protein
MKELYQVGPWIEGTLVFTTRVCGTDSCACHQKGKKHPVLFITGKAQGKTTCLYVPRRLEAEVRVWSKNYKKVKVLVRAISDVQKDMVRLREDS